MKKAEGGTNFKELVLKLRSPLVSCLLHTWLRHQDALHCCFPWRPPLEPPSPMTRGKHSSSHRTASFTFLLHSYLLSGLLNPWSGLGAFGRHSHPTPGPHYHEAVSEGMGICYESNLEHTFQFFGLWCTLSSTDSPSTCQSKGGSLKSLSTAEAHRGGVRDCLPEVAEKLGGWKAGQLEVVSSKCQRAVSVWLQ